MAHRKARLVLKEFEQYRKRVDPGDDFPTAITDMIADLLHLGDALNEAELLGAEWDPESVLERAYGHYYAEAVEPDDIELSESAAGNDLPLILAMDDDYCPTSKDNRHRFAEDRTCDLCGAKEEA